MIVDFGVNDDGLSLYIAHIDTVGHATAVLRCCYCYHYTQGTLDTCIIHV